MKLLRTVTDFARSPRGKQLVRQARALDTPANRRKAGQLLGRVRGRGTRPPR